MQSECTTLSDSERRVLRVFQEFLMTPGQMLCFHGQDLQRHRAALKKLNDRNFLIKEEFEGGYSLTKRGFASLKTVD